MDAIETHDFEKRNMTIMNEPEGKLLEKPTGSFIVETKFGKILYEYTVLPFEDFDEEKMCSFGLGKVAYGILSKDNDEVFDVEENNSEYTPPVPKGYLTMSGELSHLTFSGFPDTI